MKKTEKRTYLSPETEVVRFNVDDIITTSGEKPSYGGDIDIDSPENDVNINEP